ncbi:hypothetical protein ROA7023_01814 [Roseisalinus antarcticus]|uniref:LysE type translocator n=1 Tax=Roseisalinus antarcticus TaxID=254357 RepID=A0A1Y5SMI6_9RHOB|nr:hypothetical protein ROA7023_01814 [Roseisalinus antarcticus]
MIEPAVLLTCASIILGFVFIPGPATSLTVARATTSGTRVGIATGAGITAGDFLHTIVFAVASGGLGTFLRRNPAVLRWQGKVVGSIYCALGVRLALQER